MNSESEALLSVETLTVKYRTVTALENVSLGVKKGMVAALIGANGAGKTSTMRAITGLVAPSGGRVVFDGQDLTGWGPHRIAGLGLRMVPEGRHVFPLMSVKDNLLMGAFLRKDASGIRSDLELVAARFPRLKERWRQSAGTLSGGEQQMVALGRALMGRPRLLLLDEPSLGLAPMVVRDIARAIQEINRDGVTVLLVEQNSRMALKLSSRTWVLETGRVALEGASSDLLADDRIRRLYLGVGGEDA
jgi:branched-chain amino acid transport system ATP-binding protein